MTMTAYVFIDSGDDDDQEFEAASPADAERQAKALLTKSITAQLRRQQKRGRTISFPFTVGAMFYEGTPEDRWTADCEKVEVTVTGWPQ